VVRSWGGARHIYGPRGVPRRGGRGVMVALMPLTPLKTARLRGGSRRGS
jgi:hypothetical protein